MDKFDAFYQSHSKNLFYYLMRMTGDYYLSSDIMQESFARILRHYGPKVRDASLLYKIARNAVSDHFRKNRRIRVLEKDGREDGSADSEQLLMVRHEYRRVLNAMQQLEASEREILALVADDELSYRQIAGIVGISEGNVRVKVHRARLRLKQILDREKKA